MANEKDSEQDEMIRRNSERIARNEEAIKRQTEALEKIRDHYYPKKTLWKRVVTFFAKVSCAIFAYLGIAETVDWIWNVREANALAEKYAAAGERLFYEEGDAASAMKCYEKAAELDTKESEYLMSLTFMKGLSMAKDLLSAERPLTDEEQARVDAALAEAAVLKEMEPDNPMPHVLMAQALLLSGEQDDAIAAVKRAVACAPEDASIRVSACAIHFFSGHPAEARAYLAEAVRLDASLPLAAAWRGMFALAIDHDAEAATARFEEVTRRTPRLPMGHAMLGQALLSGKRPDTKGARAAFRRALVLDAKHMVSMMGMARTYELEGNLLVARLWYDRAIKCDGLSAKALAARANVNCGLGDWKAAAADLTAAIALDSFRADLYRERARAKEKLGDAEGAAADRKTADAIERASDTIK